MMIDIHGPNQSVESCHGRCQMYMILAYYPLDIRHELTHGRTIHSFIHSLLIVKSNNNRGLILKQLIINPGSPSRNYCSNSFRFCVCLFVCSIHDGFTGFQSRLDTALHPSTKSSSRRTESWGACIIVLTYLSTYLPRYLLSNY